MLGNQVDHIAKYGITKPHANNNRVERLNGTLRERVKVQRGWKTHKSAIGEGQRSYYNFKTTLSVKWKDTSRKGRNKSKE